MDADLKYLQLGVYAAEKKISPKISGISVERNPQASFDRCLGISTCWQEPECGSIPVCQATDLVDVARDPSGVLDDVFSHRRNPREISV